MSIPIGVTYVLACVLSGESQYIIDIADIFKFYVFFSIMMKFGMWTTIRQKTTYEHRMSLR